MRKVIFFLLVVCVWAIQASLASAAVMSLLANPTSSAANDVLADDSLGYLSDASGNGGAPGLGDVAWGIARVDSVNSVSVLNTAYIVYSVELLTPGAAPSLTTLHKETTVSGYTLDSLLGTSFLSLSGTVAAVIELTPGGTNPFTNGTKYPFGPGNFTTADAATLKTDIGTLMSNSTLLFGVGLLDTDDFFQTQFSSTSPSGDVALSLLAGLSITYKNPVAMAQVPGYDFAPLVGDPNHSGAIVWGATQVLQSPGGFPSAGGDLKTYDQGNYVVNLAPEPTSMVAFVGLGLMGLASMARRRRRNA